MHEVGLLLVSHGEFSKAAIESAELIVGKQNNCTTMGVELVDDIEGLILEMKQKIDSLDKTKGIVVLCDLLGGTPMNLALANIEENMLVVSGLNLPILLEVLMNRDKSLEDLREIIHEAHKNSLTIKEYTDLQ